MLIVRKAYASLTVLLALSLFPLNTAYAQDSSGYAYPTFTPFSITLGQSISLEDSPNCSPGKGSPSVTFYASTTPNTVGYEIGYGFDTWTPPAAGTYYISEYVSANGATCNGLSSTPRFETLTVSE